MKNLIDKIYDKHPIIWQVSVVAVLAFILFLMVWVAWQGSWGGR